MTTSRRTRIATPVLIMHPTADFANTRSAIGDYFPCRKKGGITVPHAASTDADGNWSLAGQVMAPPPTWDTRRGAPAHTGLPSRPGPTATPAGLIIYGYTETDLLINGVPGCDEKVTSDEHSGPHQRRGRKASHLSPSTDTLGRRGADRTLLRRTNTHRTNTANGRPPTRPAPSPRHLAARSRRPHRCRPRNGTRSSRHARRPTTPRPQALRRDHPHHPGQAVTRQPCCQESEPCGPLPRDIASRSGRASSADGS
jgi:hypothetical protein